jgi:hypothetical protein
MKQGLTASLAEARAQREADARAHKTKHSKYKAVVLNCFYAELVHRRSPSIVFEVGTLFRVGDRKTPIHKKFIVVCGVDEEKCFWRNSKSCLDFTLDTLREVFGDVNERDIKTYDPELLFGRECFIEVETIVHKGVHYESIAAFCVPKTTKRIASRSLNNKTNSN